MSGTTISSTDLATAAATAAKKAHTTNVASSAASTTTDTSSSGLSSLTSNFNQFLTLLSAQLQNQDPTSPTQTDTFTSEIAQFAGVQQQVQTNTNLTQLLSLNQDSEVSQSSSLVGKQAVVSSSQLALQDGTASLQFSPTSSETVDIAITNSSGDVVANRTTTLPAGTSTWSWDGKDDSGNTLTDGSYDVAVLTSNGSGGSTAVPFSVIGTITGITKNSSNGVDVEMGATTVDMSDVTSLVTTSSTTSSTTSTSSSTSS